MLKLSNRNLEQTILLITHDEKIALEADRVITIEDGKLSAIRNGGKNMWKDYSIGFIKKNRASSVSVLVAAFISALFLSLLCGLFYNFWNYEIESVVLEEGNWQGRISGAFEEDKVSEIENFANVKRL